VADARFVLQVPALPAAALLPGFSAAIFILINGRPVADAATPAISIVLGAGLFATVLGDQTALALSDPDIAILVPAQAGAVNVQLAAIGGAAGSVGALNQGAAPAGRRAGLTSFAPAGGALFVPGQRISAYLVAAAAYNPVAQESFTVRMGFSVNLKALL
jgi:hypothetical protein